MLNKDKKTILTLIRKHLPEAKVYLFGSRSRKNQQEGSDIDLALDDGKKIDFNTLLDIKADIEETTIPFFVDIVDMHAINDDFKEEIVKDGVIWTN